MEYYYLSYFCREELLHSYLEWFLQIKKIDAFRDKHWCFLKLFSNKNKTRKERRKESTIFLSAFHELFVHIVHNLLQN